MFHTVGHKLPTALSDAASLALSGLRREVSLVASLYLYCMYGYTVTVYYTCTVDSRTDPKSGTVFFSFLFVSTRVHITVDTTACFSL